MSNFRGDMAVTMQVFLVAKQKKIIFARDSLPNVAKK